MVGAPGINTAELFTASTVIHCWFVRSRKGVTVCDGVTLAHLAQTFYNVCNTYFSENLRAFQMHSPTFRGQGVYRLCLDHRSPPTGLFIRQVASFRASVGLKPFLFNYSRGGWRVTCSFKKTFIFWQPLDIEYHR